MSEVSLKSYLEKDPQIIEIKKQYDNMIQRKTSMLIALTNLEGDLHKLMGVYETISKQIIAKVSGRIAVSPTQTDPGENEIVEENKDDGFAEVKEPEVIPPTAENTNPITGDINNG